jgi:hypothetical protein
MLNWLTRYAPAVSVLTETEPESVLDVGCGPHGLACAIPGYPFVGLDVSFPGTVADSMLAVRAEPGPLPFGDAAFDTVLSLDVLEHVPRPDRASFVAELARVAARRVVLVCPTDAAAGLDALVSKRVTVGGRPEPEWLAEHREYGLPTQDEVTALCRIEGFRLEPLPMVNGFLSAMAAIADLDPELAGAAKAESTHNTRDWLGIFNDATHGPVIRAGFVLHRIEPREPQVSTADITTTTAAALRCLACGASHDERFVCTGCERTLTLDASGALDLVTAPVGSAPEPAPPAPATPTLDTKKPHRLWLSPQWSDVETWLPALSAYLANAALEGDTCLCLDVTEPDLPLDLAVEAIAKACDGLAEGAPFAEVLIVDAPVTDADTARPVATADEVLRALGATRTVPPRDPVAVTDHARWAKYVADEVRAVLERGLFERSAPVWDDGNPLVSVRIPTWHGHQRLVERTIPSVLGGSYRNIEVVVCSDGPDPEARSAVKRIQDKRVRYLELPDRPGYPDHYWSFWETAGTHAANHALDACHGKWIAPLDHDDEFTADHIAQLLGKARAERADFVYGQALCEQRQGPPTIVGRAPLAHGHVTHGSVMFSRRLGHMRHDRDCWLREEPGDWSMWRRIANTGATVAHLERVVLFHTKERTSIEDDARVGERELSGLERRTSADLATDVLGTPARWLLDVHRPAALAQAAA